MSSVKENSSKIKVLAALIGVNILKHNWRSMNWWIIVSNGRVSEEKYYISGSPAAISLCSAATTIMIHQSRSDSTIAHSHCPVPPLGSAIIITISQHDTESAIQDPPLRSVVHDPQIIIHDVVTAAALDLQTIRQRDSGEEVKSLTCIDEILISLMW